MAHRHILGARSNLSFGGPELLEACPRVKPGSVTTFAIMNDAERIVTKVLANDVLKNDPVNAHPLHNDATAAIPRDGLIVFLNLCDHQPLLIDLP